MAFIKSLAGKMDYVPIKLNRGFTVRMPLLTEQYFSDVGYIEPKTKKRLDVLNEVIDELDELDSQDSNEP